MAKMRGEVALPLLLALLALSVPNPTTASSRFTGNMPLDEFQPAYEELKRRKIGEQGAKTSGKVAVSPLSAGLTVVTDESDIQPRRSAEAEAATAASDPAHTPSELYTPDQAAQGGGGSGAADGKEKGVKLSEEEKFVMDKAADKNTKSLSKRKEERKAMDEATLQRRENNAEKFETYQRELIEQSENASNEIVDFIKKVHSILAPLGRIPLAIAIFAPGLLIEMLTGVNMWQIAGYIFGAPLH